MYSGRGALQVVDEGLPVRPQERRLMGEEHPGILGIGSEGRFADDGGHLGEGEKRKFARAKHPTRLGSQRVCYVRLQEGGQPLAARRVGQCSISVPWAGPS